MKFIDHVFRVLRVILIIYFWSWALIWFSIQADRKAIRDTNIADRTAIFLGEVPDRVKGWYSVTSTNREHQEILLDPKREIQQLGKLQNCSRLNDHLYLLHYRYLGNHTGKVLLQNIKSGEVAKSWDIPLKRIFRDLQHLKRKFAADYADESSPVHMAPSVANSIPAIAVSAPIMTEDSSLIFNTGFRGYLYKLDDNSNVVWKSEKPVHHSIEFDGKGNIWTCSLNLGHPLARSFRYREDAILCLAADGRQLAFYSLSDIFSENDLFEQVVAASPAVQKDFGRDPYHLNDVLPMTSDGRFWKKDDLFLSLRHKNLVMQYRPSTGDVIWYQQGPWLTQHDINVVSDSVISVFNNNDLMLSNQMSKQGSNIAVFDFVDGTTQFFGQGNFATRTQGRQTQTADNCILVEETNKATYIILDSTGAALCRFYIPYHANPSHAMNPTWGRLYLRDGSTFVLQ